MLNWFHYIANGEFSLNFIKNLFKKKEDDPNLYLGLFNIDLTDWWKSTFSTQERELICNEFKPNSQGILGGSTRTTIFTVDHFNIKDEAVIPFLENLSNWLSKHQEISQKIFLKFIDVANYDPICNKQKLIEDKHYRNWVILRNLVFFNIYCLKKMNLERVQFSFGNYEAAPEVCRMIDGKVFNLNSELSLIVQHWDEYKPACRCVLFPEIEEGILID